MADFIPKQYTKEPITIRIAPDKLAQIDAFAAKFNMSRSEFINQCIDYALNNLTPDIKTTATAVVFCYAASTATPRPHAVCRRATVTRASR